ncbi:MAG: ABC transporter permease [Candidatus Nezhaarchaeota archaeon]|nr:ABC transporter permease [Candidatus Nezhaarchaeota archaeon]MCX8141223.1 ABC transporter permease [Candidatus Nezhaarchaeota archaeon]MDW8049489.1 ABC transporter permease [Nitrososphaerota archaeon]
MGRFSDRVFGSTFLVTLGLAVIMCIVVVASPLLHVELRELAEAISSRRVLLALSLSLLTSTISTIICMVIAVPSAYVLSRYSVPGKNVITTLLSLPIVLPPVAIGASLLMFFANTSIGELIQRVIRIIFEVPGIIVAQTVVITPLAIWALRATFDGIDPKYEDVAKTLGLSNFSIFFKIVLPMAKSGLLSAVVLAWARAMGEFGASIMLAGATPMKTETLPIAIYLALAGADIPKACAVILILIATSFIALIAIQKGAQRIS